LKIWCPLRTYRFDPDHRYRLRRLPLGSRFSFIFIFFPAANIFYSLDFGKEICTSFADSL
ncbi:hypothetical protein, partial [Lactobacillus delbrueckii]|uniref:hypothetical protein n=1 Tax=Lactobacillus delbrueckii TaxID=1584 RepID=UPI001C707EC3